MTIKELKPQYTSNKSYYKKAYIITDDDGTLRLKSYDTIVAQLSPDGTFIKLWNGYSRTTMKHIIDFCGQYNINFTPNKANWLALPHNRKTQYYIAGSNGIITHEFKNTLFDNYDDAEEYATQKSNNFWYYWVEEL